MYMYMHIYKLWPGGEVLTSQSPKFCSCETSHGPELNTKFWPLSPVQIAFFFSAVVSPS